MSAVAASMAAVAFLGLHPSGAHAAGPLLAGTTVITGSTPASEVVTLDAPATVQFLPIDSPDVHFAGTGRLIGFYLTKTDGSVSFGESRVNGCSAYGCAPHPAVTAGGDAEYPQMVGSSESSPETLTPGDYVLTFIADGPSDSVTLTLPGLGGSTSLMPAGAADVQIVTPTPTLAASAVGDVNSAGMEVDPGATSWSPFVIAGMVLNGTDLSAGDIGGCVYWGAAPPGNAYLPECPAATVTIGSDIPVSITTDQWGAGMIFLSAVPRGETSAAGIYDVAGLDITYTSRVLAFVQPLRADQIAPSPYEPGPAPTWDVAGAHVGDPELTTPQMSVRNPEWLPIDAEVGGLSFRLGPPGTIVSF
ncbi:MAG TPA: hypothetical protein VFC09_05140 [Candidatus Dormibacteraeota bacterium]|nr:hypothetical protein [Candidatus Dormibacteraeota bacterium]